MMDDEELISEDKRIDVLEDEVNCQIVEANIRTISISDVVRLKRDGKFEEFIKLNKEYNEYVDVHQAKVHRTIKYVIKRLNKAFVDGGARCRVFGNSMWFLRAEAESYEPATFKIVLVLHEEGTSGRWKPTDLKYVPEFVRMAGPGYQNILKIRDKAWDMKEKIVRYSNGDYEEHK